MTTRNTRPKCMLAPESEAIVDQVIALLSIPQNAVFYQQNTFMEISEVNECQTECCLAGWMAFVGNRRAYKKLEKYVRINDSVVAAKIALLANSLMKRWNGRSINTSNLFAGSGAYWPGALGSRWVRACNNTATLEEQQQAFAAIAVDRLKYLKKHGR